MPQIPLKISEETIPGKTGSPNMPMNDPIGEALERSGARLSHQFGQMYEVEQNAERHVEAAKHDNYLKEWIAQKAEGLQGRTDYENFNKEFENNKKELSSYVEKIQDPKVKSAVDVVAQNYFHYMGDLYRKKKLSAMVDVNKAELLKATNLDLEEWRYASSDASETGVSERGMIQARMVARAEAGVKAGLLSNVELQQFVQNIDLKLKKIEKEEQDTQVDFNIKSDPEFRTKDNKFDYQKAITALTDPKVYKDKFGMQKKEAAEYVNILKAEERYNLQKESEEANKTYTAELDQIGELVLVGKVKEATKLVKESTVINGLDKVKLIKSFHVGSGGEGGGSSKETFLQAADMMYDSAIPYETKKKWLVENQNKLSKGEFKHWVTVASSGERTSYKGAVKAGIDILKSSLLTPGMSSMTQKNRLAFAIQTFESGLKEYGERLNTPEEIKKYAYQVLAIPQYANSSPIEDMKLDMKRMRGVGVDNSFLTLSDEEQELQRRGYKKVNGAWVK